MAIKMRVLYASGKKKINNIANMIKAKYDLAFNAVDVIPPAYSCDKERIVILAISAKGHVSDAIRLFCRELTKARAELDTIPEITVEGQTVAHRMFGTGLVVKQNGSHIEVKFAAKTSTFILTTAFVGGFLSSQDQTILERCKRFESAIAYCDKLERVLKSKRAEWYLLQK